MSNSPHHSLDEPIDVLLVEDNPGDVRLTQEAFTATNCETALHVVTNGDDAIDFLTQQGAYESAPLPDLILLDLNLPGKTGYEILDSINDETHLRSLPVLVLTSSKDSEDVARCYGSNANAYLTKPTDPDELTSLVEATERFWFKQVQHPPIPA